MGRAPARKAVVSPDQYCRMGGVEGRHTCYDAEQVELQGLQHASMQHASQPGQTPWPNELSTLPIYLRVVDANERQAGGPPADGVQGSLAHVQVGATGGEKREQAKVSCNAVCGSAARGCPDGQPNSQREESGFGSHLPVVGRAADGDVEEPGGQQQQRPAL